MRDKRYKKVTAWMLIVAMLNLLLVMASGGMVMAESQQSKYLTPDQTSSLTDVSPCHDETITTPDLNSKGTDKCSDTQCDNDCSLCLQIGYVMPIQATFLTMVEHGGFAADSPFRLINPSYDIIPPPPKPFST